jgi:NAD+ kinase
MRLAITGKIRADVERLKQQARKLGFQLSQKPDLVISFGGDGSLLYAERVFPGVPKLPLRNKSLCLTCNEGNLEALLGALKQRRFRVVSYPKLEARAKGKVLLAANDLVIRNLQPYAALRFSLSSNGKRVGEFIGDGCVIATTFGSTGYFRSVSHCSFDSGFGLALNNPTKQHDPLYTETPKFRITILRGEGVLCADNNALCIPLSRGDIVTVRKSAKLIRVVRGERHV